MGSEGFWTQHRFSFDDPSRHRVSGPRSGRGGSQMTLPESSESVTTALLLGAGFSRAVSAHMPLTDELGEAVVERLSLHPDPRVPPGGFHDGAFETWLSHLATEQPFLTTQENLENQALFLKLSEALAEVLGKAMQAALADPEPVKASETRCQDFFCRSVWMVGLLIQATAGSLGGEGRRPQNR